MKKIKASITISLMAVSIALFASATSAQAEMSTEYSETPMVLTGYDAGIARENGYEIIINDDGVEESIPVRSDAVASEKMIPIGRTARVDGPCGSSWINAKHNGQHKTITTGYSVPNPVVAKSWTVQVWGWDGLPSNFWGGPSGGTWFDSWSYFGGGDFANVLPGSNVVMNNGAVCASGSPGENFHG